MQDAAAFHAVFVTFRPMKTQPVLKIELEVPIERAEQVTAALGWPKPGESVHVAVARLEAED
jgi:hypothetical protein